MNRKNNGSLEFNIFGYPLWKVFSYFVVYSVLGFIVETIYGLLTKGVIESRQSVLYGPFCGIYGLGAVCLICIPKYLKKNSWNLFLSGLCIGTIIEYVISWIGECIFYIRWWDYSNLPFNVNGRVCLLYSAFWGILTIFLNKVIHPSIDEYLDKIVDKIKLVNYKRILTVIILFLALDQLVSTFATKMFFTKIIYNYNVENVLGIDAYYDKYLDLYLNNDFVKNVVDKFFSDEKMLKTYPNIKLTLKNGEILLVKNILKDIKPYYIKVFTPSGYFIDRHIISNEIERN